LQKKTLFIQKKFQTYIRFAPQRINDHIHTFLAELEDAFDHTIVQSRLILLSITITIIPYKKQFLLENIINQKEIVYVYNYGTHTYKYFWEKDIGWYWCCIYMRIDVHRWKNVVFSSYKMNQNFISRQCNCAFSKFQQERDFKAIKPQIKEMMKIIFLIFFYYIIYL